MFNLGTQELLIIGAIVMVLFGGSKIPELMKGIGSGVREFKNAVETPEKPEDPRPAVKTDDDKA
jgi:sec-independent protein translocase protein TatA